MKNWFVLVFALLSLAADAQVGELIWEDNFNSKKLDTTFWNYETGTGLNGDWGTGQLDEATDRKKNVRIKFGVAEADSGCLAITTRNDQYNKRDYSSGRVNTSGKAAWGPGHRIVARVWPRDVTHQGQGFAFWMMPNEVPEGHKSLMWPQGGEIDIMEYVGSIPRHNLGSVHYAKAWENNEWKANNHKHQGAYYSFARKGTPENEPQYTNTPAEANDESAGSTGFHTYGIDWHTDRMEFFVDGRVYHIHYFEDGTGLSEDGQDNRLYTSINGTWAVQTEFSHHFDEWRPFEHQHYVILSAGVGGAQHTYGGAIVPEAKFPCTVFVDWVRVYRLEETQAE